MYDKVILPTDGSVCAMKGVREGLEMAEKLDIEALSIYVLDRSEYEGLHHESIKSTVKGGFKEKGEEALEKVKEAAKERDVELETRIVEGTPYKEITRAAGDNDIIYISTHGLSGFTHMFLGSTTERVLKNTENTVAVVNGR
ncbi:MAG: universal stress protein [Candidatus Aenigmatarchaeota archaeon]